MRTMLAVVLVAFVASFVSAQQSDTSVTIVDSNVVSAVANEIEGASGTSVLDGAETGAVEPVIFIQSGSATRSAVPQVIDQAGSASRVIVEPNLGGSSTRSVVDSPVATESSSIVTGEVVSGDVVGGQVITGGVVGGEVVTGAADCGCGAAPVEAAPAVTYSSAPACDAPAAAAPCCPTQQRRGFFRRLFGF
jgi:hypothetical protein